MLSLLTLFSFLIELCEATEVVTVAHILPVLGFEHLREIVAMLHFNTSILHLF